MSPVKRPRTPLFVERESYRRRRVMDAARILPVAGLVLVLLPVLWTQSGKLGTAGESIYLFALWLVLIVAAAVLSRPLRNAIRRDAARPERLEPTAEAPASDSPATDSAAADSIAADPGTADPPGPHR